MNKKTLPSKEFRSWSLVIGFISTYVVKPLKVVGFIPPMARCTWYDKVCLWPRWGWRFQSWVLIPPVVKCSWYNNTWQSLSVTWVRLEISVVGFDSTNGEVFLIQHLTKFVCDLGEVGGFPRYSCLKMSIFEQKSSLGTVVLEKTIKMWREYRQQQRRQRIQTDNMTTSYDLMIMVRCTKTNCNCVTEICPKNECKAVAYTPYRHCRVNDIPKWNPQSCATVEGDRFTNISIVIIFKEPTIKKIK